MSSWPLSWPLIASGALAGAIAGSFVGAVVERWPRGESVARGRSRCDSCGHVLGAAELVPIVSYWVQRGRCRRCGASIAPAHLAAEVACAIVGATALAAAPLPVAAAGALFGWTLVALALLDVEHFWLPDRLTLPLGVGGIAVAAAGLGPPLDQSLIGVGLGYGVLAGIAALYKRARGRTGMGAGDPKLMGAIGAWLGWPLLAPVLLMASLLGLASVALRAARGDDVRRTDRLPLGTLLALSAWPLWLIGTVLAG